MNDEHTTPNLLPFREEIPPATGYTPKPKRKKKESKAPEPLAVTVSMSRKINLGQYEMAEAFVSLSGVLPTTTQEEIDVALANGKVAWEAVRLALNAKVSSMRDPNSEELP
jgi:hypothetical protein